MWIAVHTLHDTDNVVIRIRGTTGGTALTVATESLLGKMKKAGYDSKKHSLHKRYKLISHYLRGLRGEVNSTLDADIRMSLREKYYIYVSDEDLIKFSGFLISIDPAYPSRCSIEGNGRPLTCRDSKEYYLAYLKFIQEGTKKEVDFYASPNEGYSHKSEKEIARLSPTERVEEMAKEYHYHFPFGAAHEYSNLLQDYIIKDGANSLQVLADIAGKFDPTNPSSYDQTRLFIIFHLASEIDNSNLRVRGTKAGIRLLRSLRGVLDRMKKAGYDDFNLKDVLSRMKKAGLDVLGRKKNAGYDDTKTVETKYFGNKRRWEYAFYSGDYRILEGRFPSFRDEDIRSTLQKKYNIHLPEAAYPNDEMTKFSNYLTSFDPTYPKRCKISELPPRVCKDSKEFYEAYRKFVKSKSKRELKKKNQ